MHLETLLAAGAIIVMNVGTTLLLMIWSTSKAASSRKGDK